MGDHLLGESWDGWFHLRYSGYSMAGPPALGNSLLIVCFGDAKRGQLGVEPVTGARQPETRTRTPQVNS